jgi:hypothetical protein
MHGLQDIVKVNRGKNYKAEEKRAASKIKKQGKAIVAFQREIERWNEKNEAK